jgi:hypothetical protein
LGIAPKTLRNKVAAGIFREGEHFHRVPGLGRLWKWEAVVSSIERGTRAAERHVIPLARPGDPRGE